MSNNRRTNMQISGLPLDDIRDALVAAAVPESDEERDARRSADEDVALAEMAHLRAQRKADEQAAHDAANTPDGGREAGRRARLW